MKLDYPLGWSMVKISVMNHFAGCGNFENRWNNWSNELKECFVNIVIFFHNAGYDWYHTDTPDLRIGYHPQTEGNGRNIALILYDQRNPQFQWTNNSGQEGQSPINDDLLTMLNQENLLNNVRTSFERGGNVPVRALGDSTFWPDRIGHGPVNPEGIIEEHDDEELLGDNGMKLNTILYGPPGTGKTHSVTALALSILSQPEQQAQYNAALILNGRPPLGEENQWRSWIGEFNANVKQGRIEVTTFHQNYSYEDFVEGLKASAVMTDGRSSVFYKYESGILKRMAYRALYAWLTGNAPLAAEMLESELSVVQYWLKNGEMPVTATTHREANTVAPPFVIIIDEINRGNVARIFGELITLVEESKRARLHGEIGTGHQPLAATLPYTKEPFILPPNLYIIGTMNTADRSLVGLDAALRRRFKFVELAPQPQLLRNVGNGEDEVNLGLLLTALNDRIFRAEESTDHEIGHAYFWGLETIDDLANVMARQVIPQLREYFFDQSSKIHAILAPVGQIRSPFIDVRGKTVMAALRDSGHYRRLYGAP